MELHEHDIEYVLAHLNEPEKMLDAEFQTWLNLPGHLALFEHVRNQREAFLRRKYEVELDVMQEYTRFSRRIGHPEKRINPVWWAAAVCVMIGCFTVWMNKSDRSAQEMAKSEIPAGKKSAELILANGKRVNLENNAIELQEENGMLIINDTSCQLTYQDRKNDKGNQKLIYNVIKVPAGADYMVCLADGTRVRLNCGTEFKFPIEFAANERRVFLNGEAFFEVESAGKWPFIVETDKMKVQVTGTGFNVRSYPNENLTHTTLLHGAVNVNTVNGQQYHLLPSQQFCLDKYTGRAEVKIVDVNLYTGWTEGLFVFKDQRLEEVMNMLSQWYQIEIFYASPDVKDIRLSANLGRYEDIDTLLKILRTLDKIDIVRKGTVVTVSRK